jgi:hypothetical protein
MIRLTLAAKDKRRDNAFELIKEDTYRKGR